MRVLVACEFSGVVRETFRNHWHHAWSCDILPAEVPWGYDYDGDPIPHFQRDIFQVLESEGRWDLIIAHPPCTHLAVSGNRWYSRTEERAAAIGWTRHLWDRMREVAEHVCLEQPVSVLSKFMLPTKPQYIQPWMFGHGETKKTALYLHNLPPLEPTDVVEGREPRVHYMSPSKDRGLRRSVTYDGIADAMVKQWGNL